MGRTAAGPKFNLTLVCLDELQSYSINVIYYILSINYYSWNMLPIDTIPLLKDYSLLRIMIVQVRKRIELLYISIYSSFLSSIILYLLVDVWSVGCIFSELIGGKPLFTGRDRILSSMIYNNVHCSTCYP